MQIFDPSISGSTNISGSTTIVGDLIVSGSISSTTNFAGTASFASTASYINPLRQDVKLTGSLAVTGSEFKTDVDSFIVDYNNIAVLQADNNGVYIYGTDGKTALNAEDRVAYDLNSSSSIDWQTRQLYKNDGSTIVLDWQNQVFTGSVFGTASWAQNSSTASFVNQAVSASFAQTASLAFTASFVQTAQTASYVQNAQTASYVLNAVSASFSSTASFVRNAQTASYVLNAVSSSFASTASLAQTASFVATASWSNNAITASYILQAESASYASTASYALEAISSSFATSASQAQNANTASYIATASWSENAITASYILNAVSSSFASTASYILDAVSSSFASTASYVLNAVSSSYSETSSYSANAELLDNKDSSVFATTGSNLFTETQIISGALQLNPTLDPGGINTTSSFLFVTSSGDNTEFNLHYRNNGALWETHWLEERVDTGLVWGGVVTFTGTTMSITPGAGLIINHNANTGSHGDTIPTYVQFGPITASATFITSSQVTYLLIDTDGSLIQQTNIFTPQQFNEKLPLGYIFCLTTSSISSYADARTTTYGQDEQQTQFIRAFGPLKVSGYDITPQSGSLKISIASGRSYRFGGFYTQNPDNPSLYDSSAVATGSLVRVYKDPSVVGGFKATLNGLVPFTDIDPTMWDDGSGTLQAVGANEWTIQRVFQGVVNGISYVYYGQSTYDSLNAAIQSITTEPFDESQTSILALPFIGYIIARGNTTDLGDTTNNKLINSGLFRNTAGSSGGGGVATTNLNDLADVTITSPSTGQALVYNAGIWENGTPLNSTSASYSDTASYVALAQTASYITTAQTASYVLQAVSASYSTTASYALTAESLIGSVTSASYADTASYVQNAQSASYVLQAVSSSFASTASYVTTAQTASYVNGANVDGNITGNANNITAYTIDQNLSTTSQVTFGGVTSSLFGTASWATNAINVPGGLANYITRWEDADTITTSSLYEGTNKNIGINTTTFDVTNPQALLVSGSNINVISGESNINTYTQLNIINRNTGNASSADIVATNNTGNESGNYVDLGINGSNYTGFLGVANEAYLYNTGSNFLIGNITRGANANLKLFAGNDATVFPIIVTGSVAIMTGSLQGTASFASTASVATTASYALTASVSLDTFSKGGTVYNADGITNNASYIVWRATFPCTASKIYGYREGGTATNVNVLKNTSLLRSTDLSITGTSTWTDFGTLQNVNIAAGDSLAIVVSGSGTSPIEISVQIDLSR